MPFGLWAWTGPRSHQLDGGPGPLWEGAIFWERVAYCNLETFCRELCRNGWTDRFAVWFVDSGGPKEAAVESYSPGGASISDDTLLWPVQKQLNWSICCLSCGLERAEVSASSTVFARWHQCAHWHHLENTIEPSVCGGDAVLMSNYCDHLLFRGQPHCFIYSFYLCLII